MSKTITFLNELDESENETCVIDDVSEDFDSLSQLLSNSNELNEDLIKLAREFKLKIEEVKNTRRNIQCTKYSKDNILCKIIELSRPPYFLKHQLFNYKSIVLYFMRTFRDTTILKYNDFRDTIQEGYDTTILQETFFKNNEKISIKTHMDTLLHLINIDKKKIKEERVYEHMIYDTLDFGDYTQKLELFKSKIASIGWIKDTINKPDFIYANDSIIAKHLNFDFAFIRQTGSGTISQKYMYHLVGFKNMNQYSHTVITQFPIEKDRKVKENEIVSSLHKYVQCNKPIYARAGVNMPLYSDKLVQNTSNHINKLMNHYKKDI